jgi:drug/metabolite transporter (DMT)-like permease
VPELGGPFVGAARSVLAGILAALVLAVRRQAFPRGAVLRLWLVALGVVFGFPLTTAIALRTVPASHATVLIGLVPMATAVYAILRNRERPAPEFWVASVAYDWPSRPLASVSNAALLGLGYVSLVSMYLAMVAWYRGLSLGSVARGSQIQLVQPVLGLFWAWALLGEAVAGTTLLAACFVVLCAVRARRARIAVARP